MATKPYIEKVLGKHLPLSADWQVPAWPLESEGMYLIEDDDNDLVLVLRLHDRVDDDGNDIIDEIEQWVVEEYGDDYDALERGVIRDLRKWRLIR